MDEQAPSGTVISSSARDLLLAHIDRFGAYHTQKETMTWSAATLYVVAISVLLAAGREPFWHRAPWWKFWPFVVLLAVSAAAVFAFVARQFERRLSSHLLVHACSNVSAQWLTREPTVAECQPVSLGDYGLGADQDYQLMPKAVIDELDRMAKRKAEYPGRYRFRDRYLTFVVMGAWTAAGIVRVLTSWRPIADMLERWVR